jgi:chaperonin cofactor prefoldin
MFWIALAILTIVGWVIYSRHKSSVLLTKDQAELALELIRKELTEIEKKRVGMIDDAAVDGKTIPLEKLFPYSEDESESVKVELKKMKKELFDKYGPMRLFIGTRACESFC